MVGAVIYGIPVAIRVVTGNVYLPVLSLLATPWIDHYVPGNLIEKILVQAFFPGGAGGVAGEIIVANHDVKPPTGRRIYIARLSGALLWTGAWSLFQLWGNMQNIIGSFQGNLFEYPMVFPLNFLIASFSIFTPDVLGFLKREITKAQQRLKGNKQGCLNQNPTTRFNHDENRKNYTFVTSILIDSKNE